MFEKFLTETLKLAPRQMWGVEQLGVYFIDKATLCETMSDTPNAAKINKFAYKLFEYLWDDVAKFAHAEWFGTDVRTLDELIDKFVREGKAVFANGIL